MKHLFYKIKLPIYLLRLVIFVILTLSVNCFASKQEAAPEEENSKIMLLKKNRQAFKEGKFKPLYSPSIYEDAQGPIARFDPMAHEEFSMIETEMRYMIYARNKNHIINHLCAVGYVLKGGDHEVVVVWRETGFLIGWGGGSVKSFKEWGFHLASSMFASPTISMSSLAKDKTTPLGNGSIAYREDAESTIADCNEHGKQYVIQPFTPPPSPFE